MQYLKQSTSQTIMFGPFVDKADGITLKTDATTITDIDHATTGIFLSKAGAAAAIRYQTSKVASVAGAYGMMCVTLLATDTDTVGLLDVLFAKAATYLPVHKTFMVLPAQVYNSLMGTDLLDISLVQINGAAQTATLDTIKTQLADVHDTDLPAVKTDTAAVKVMTDKIGTVVNTGGTASLGAILGDFANSALVTRVADIHTDVADVHTDVADVKVDTAAIKVPTNKLVFTVANQVDSNVITKTGFALSATGLDLILHGATFMVANAVAVWELAVRTITALPAITTDWLTGAGVKADAVTKIQAGLATPTNITAAAGIVLSATQAAYAPAKAGDAMMVSDKTGFSLLRPTGVIVTDGSNSTTTFKTNLTSSEDNYIKDGYVKFTSGANINQVKKISVYNGTTKFITTTAFTDIPTGDDTFIIINE